MVAKDKPGPGWSKTKDGEWVAHFFTFADFPGAQTVAVVFKGLAALILVGGIIVAVEVSRNLNQNYVSRSHDAAIVGGVVAGTIVAASTMAFFGYVLQLLTAIHYDIRYKDAATRLSRSVPSGPSDP